MSAWERIFSDAPSVRSARSQATERRTERRSRTNLTTDRHSQRPSETQPEGKKRTPPWRLSGTTAIRNVSATACPDPCRWRWVWPEDGGVSIGVRQKVRPESIAVRAEN